MAAAATAATEKIININTTPFSLHPLCGCGGSVALWPSLSSHRRADQPAVNLQRNSGHIARPLRGQKGHDLANLARLADPLQRDFSRLTGEILFVSDSPLLHANV